MNTQLERDHLWRKYLAAAHSSITTPQDRQRCFQAWWRLERADSIANSQADQIKARAAEAEKRRRASRISRGAGR